MAVRLKPLLQGFFMTLRESLDSYNTTKISVAHQVISLSGEYASLNPPYGHKQHLTNVKRLFMITANMNYMVI